VSACASDGCVCGGKYIDVWVCHSTLYNCKLSRCLKIEKKPKQKIKKKKKKKGC
jgi:hypothetical protein